MVAYIFLFLLSCLRLRSRFRSLSLFILYLFSEFTDSIWLWKCVCVRVCMCWYERVNWTARDNQISYPTRWEKYDELGEKLDYILPYSIIELIILSWELNELLLLTLRAFHVVRVYLGTWCLRLLFIFMLELRWTANESEKGRQRWWQRQRQTHTQREREME